MLVVILEECHLFLAGRQTGGRIYITLGPPISIQTYENLSSIYPTIVWYYQGMSKYRLPDVFNMVFFKKRGTGDYRLYSPSMDGPQSLVAHISSGQIDSRSAYRELQSETPALAQVSLSLLGDCYYQKGNKKEALKTWEKSLKLNPNQEEIKKSVNLIKIGKK